MEGDFIASRLQAHLYSISSLPQRDTMHEELIKKVRFHFHSDRSSTTAKSGQIARKRPLMTRDKVQEMEGPTLFHEAVYEHTSKHRLLQNMRRHAILLALVEIQ